MDFEIFFTHLEREWMPSACKLFTGCWRRYEVTVT